MTLTESASLSPDQLRVAVAERMGWTLTKERHFKVLRRPGETDTGYCMWIQMTDEECWQAGLEGDENGDYQFPNYPESLDACATFEATLTEEQQDEYAFVLSQLVPQKMNCGPAEDDGPDIMVHREFELINAEPMLRCRAFLAVTSAVSETRNE